MRNPLSQWWIQNFPELKAPTLQGDANIRFDQIFRKIAWNWKYLDPGGTEGCHCPKRHHRCPVAPRFKGQGILLLDISHFNKRYIFPNWSIWFKMPIRHVDTNCNDIWWIELGSRKSPIGWLELHRNVCCNFSFLPPRRFYGWLTHSSIVDPEPWSVGAAVWIKHDTDLTLLERKCPPLWCCAVQLHQERIWKPINVRKKIQYI